MMGAMMMMMMMMMMMIIMMRRMRMIDVLHVADALLSPSTSTRHHHDKPVLPLPTMVTRLL